MVKHKHSLEKEDVPLQTCTLLSSDPFRYDGGISIGARQHTGSVGKTYGYTAPELSPTIHECLIEGREYPENLFQWPSRCRI